MKSQNQYVFDENFDNGGDMVSGSKQLLGKWL
jgi:hypothetical protein